MRPEPIVRLAVRKIMARVDGEAVVCAITAEALEDHFGADSALEATLNTPPTHLPLPHACRGDADEPGHDGARAMTAHGASIHQNENGGIRTKSVSMADLLRLLKPPGMEMELR